MSYKQPGEQALSLPPEAIFSPHSNSSSTGEASLYLLSSKSGGRSEDSLVEGIKRHRLANRPSCCRESFDDRLLIKPKRKETAALVVSSFLKAIPEYAGQRMSRKRIDQGCVRSLFNVFS